MHFVTIDTGTTNSRIFVWRDGKQVAEASRPVGVRDTAITGSREALAAGVRDAVVEALARAGLTAADDVTVLASGMISSNMGLCEIPHLVAPVGVQELAAGIRKVALSDIVDWPVWFIPGVRNSAAPVNADNCETMDMMRGEETEAIGTIRALGVRGPAVIILPGSHSKFVKIGADNRIEGCITTISGELLDAITKHTILASSLDHGFADAVDAAALLKGAEHCRAVGLSRCCFSVRILDTFGGMTVAERQNFLLGAVLQTDILALKNSAALRVGPDTRMIVAGKRMLKEALAILLENDAFFTETITTVPETSGSLSGLGALEIARVAATLAMKG